MSIENAVIAAAADIAEHLDGGKSRKRMEVMRSFLEAAIWSAAAHAEGLPKNAWVDSNIDDSWTRTAKGVEVELPDITPEQTLQMLERLKLGGDNLRSQIIPRIKSAPEGDTLKKDLEAILGKPGYFDKYLATDSLAKGLPGDVATPAPMPSRTPLAPPEPPPAPKEAPAPEPEAKGREKVPSLTGTVPKPTASNDEFELGRPGVINNTAAK
jgi:hypothetical protein